MTEVFSKLTDFQINIKSKIRKLRVRLIVARLEQELVDVAEDLFAAGLYTTEIVRYLEIVASKYEKEGITCSISVDDYYNFIINISYDSIYDYEVVCDRENI